MAVARRPEVVLFDLFNTLVPGGTRSERDAVSTRMAEILDVDPGALADLFRSTFDQRTRGHLGDLRETIAHLCRELGVTPSDRALATAVDLRLAMTLDLHRRSWALPVLEALRDRGIGMGLVSDCSAETPAIWPRSPLAPYLAATSFSCETGRRKPEPAAYLHAVDQLDVSPAECVFVGDGGSHELSGAMDLGMRAIRFAPVGGSIGDAIDEDGDWAGLSIHDLLEVVALFGDRP